MKQFNIPVIKTTTTPTNPPAGFLKIYFKGDGLLYKLDSAGAETVIGAGGGGGGGDMLKATYDAANINEQLVGLNATQTLTNKILTSPVINSPTGLVKANVGLSNVDNTSDATKNSAIATLTNKRITRRVTTETSSATPTINSDNSDMHRITALAAAITSFTTNLTGTPTDGQNLWIVITDNGTARAITRGASFEASGNVSLPTTTVISTRLDVGFVWNTVTSKRRCIAVA